MTHDLLANGRMIISIPHIISWPALKFLAQKKPPSWPIRHWVPFMVECLGIGKSPQTYSNLYSTRYVAILGRLTCIDSFTCYVPPCYSDDRNVGPS